MAEKSKDKGRNFYETSSPFETTEPSSARPKTFSGRTDTLPVSDAFPKEFIPGSSVVKNMQAEQYDNPRGYPGLAMLTTGDEKSKLGSIKQHHSIAHHMEGGAKLTRTGK